MKNKDTFVKIYGDEVLEDFLFELMHFFSDDEKCISEKNFLKWYKIYEYFKKKYDRAADPNED